MSRVPLTKEGEISIKEKLSHLKFVERPQISQAIAEARLKLARAFRDKAKSVNEKYIVRLNSYCYRFRK